MDFNSAETAFIIEKLPPEMQRMFFEYFDIQTLVNVSEVNDLWHSLVQDISRQIIHKYFPYCKITQPEVCINNPLKLIAHEYKRYKADFQDIEMSLILSALCGNKNAIKTEKNKEYRMLAYSLFFANGHPPCSLKGFTTKDKRKIIGYALQNAAQNGHLSALQDLLEATNKGHQGWALFFGAQNGHLPIVKHILNTVGPDLSLRDTMRALREASNNEHFHIVKTINGWRLCQAAILGNPSLMKMLLTAQQPGQEISSEDKGLALILSAEHITIGCHHLYTIEKLIVQAGSEISLEYKETAIKFIENTPNNNYNCLKFSLVEQLRMDICCQKLKNTIITPGYNHHLLLSNRPDEIDEHELNTKKESQNNNGMR